MSRKNVTHESFLSEDANSDKDTTKEFQEINNAYELLKNEIQRAIENTASTDTSSRSWSQGVKSPNTNGFGFGRYDKVDKSPYQPSYDSSFENHVYKRASTQNQSRNPRYSKVDPSPFRWPNESSFHGDSRYENIRSSPYQHLNESPFDGGSRYGKVDPSPYQGPNESSFDIGSRYNKVDPSPFRGTNEYPFDIGPRYDNKADSSPYHSHHQESHFDGGPRPLKRDGGVRDKYRSVRFAPDHNSYESSRSSVGKDYFGRATRTPPRQSASPRKSVKDRVSSVRHGRGSFTSNSHRVGTGRRSKQPRTPAATSDVRSRKGGRVIVGDDIRTEVEIDSNTGILGGKVKVFVRHYEVCHTCDGSGARDRSHIRSCRACGGAVHAAIGAFQEQQSCPICHGTGQEIEQPCGSCAGDGVMKQTKQIMVTIPPRVKDGNWLHIPGEGNAGPNGGPPGDLYVYITIKKVVPDVEKEEVRVNHDTSKIARNAKKESEGSYFAKTWRWMKNTLIRRKKHG